MNRLRTFITLCCDYLVCPEKNLKSFTNYLITAKEKYTMKNIAMRSFVLVLALVGFAATSMTSSAKTTSTSATKTSIQTQTSVVMTPTPLCAPGSTCGMD